MPKKKLSFACSGCGYETYRWIGKCPVCDAFNTINEVAEETKTVARTVHTAKPLVLSSISLSGENRIATDISELDRVLSGGLVDGSLTLVGGEPGIGKSTLLLQLCQKIGEKGKKVLYVSGEESLVQIKLRAHRLDIETENLFLLAETNLTAIQSVVYDIKPQLIIVDSIQTVYIEELENSAGSTVQIRESAALLMRLCKSLNISTIIVGHVTKEGSLAGPRILEHMVDTVLYFEGEHRENYRLIRAVKNRFGATNEIGVFEMTEKGLSEIVNPSAYMLSGRPMSSPGSVVTCSLEGTRPILTEVQALVTYTSFGMPRRTSTGMDYNRVVMLIAVLEKHIGMQFSSYDSYVNVAGGLKIVEPSIDAAVVAVLASSFRNKAIDPYMMIIGEVGLSGEIRAVSSSDRRIAEAYKMGFKSCIVPQTNLRSVITNKDSGYKNYEGMRIFGVANIKELVEIIFD